MHVSKLMQAEKSKAEEEEKEELEGWKNIVKTKIVWDFIGCKVISIIFPFSHVILGKWQKVRLSEMLNRTKTTIVSNHWIIFVFFLFILFQHIRINCTFAMHKIHTGSSVQCSCDWFRIKNTKIQRKKWMRELHMWCFVLRCNVFRIFYSIFYGNKIHRVDWKTKNDKDGIEKIERGNCWLLFDVWSIFRNIQESIQLPVKIINIQFDIVSFLFFKLLFIYFFFCLLLQWLGVFRFWRMVKRKMK